jgi:hypothetical protein
MRDLEIWFYKNNLIINTEKRIAESFHTEQNRVPLRLQITFKNKNITCQSELRFLGLYLVEDLKFGTHVQSLRRKLCKVVYVR